MLPLLLHPSWGGDSSWAVLGTETGTGDRPSPGTMVTTPCQRQERTTLAGHRRPRGLGGTGPLLQPPE
ncbi:hypothetical protein Nmel_013299 [Mimus melanotis]